MLNDSTLDVVVMAIVSRYNYLHQFEGITDDDIIKLCTNSAAWAIRCNEIADECNGKGNHSFSLRAKSEELEYRQRDNGIIDKYPQYAEILKRMLK